MGGIEMTNNNTSIQNKKISQHYKRLPDKEEANKLVALWYKLRDYNSSIKTKKVGEEK